MSPVPGPTPRTTIYRHRVRYLEVDQQGVVFNMWFLGYFDEAMSAFLAEGGLPYENLLESGHDVQLVHTEIDWSSSLRWADDASVAVSLAALGRTSFTLTFAVSTGGADVATRPYRVRGGSDGRLGKRPIPENLLAALGSAPG